MLIEVLLLPELLLVWTNSVVDNASVVLRVAYRDVSFLLTGDIFANAEREMLTRNAGVETAILKVAHHGSRTSSLPEFIELVSLLAAVISVGDDNRFGHLQSKTIETLRELVADDRIFRTSKRGTVEFITDGTTLSVKTER